jgi:hypothetical protein
MRLIDSLGRSRMGAFLAWIAIVSMGALGVARDPAGLRALDGGAQASMVRALADAPTHVVRINAVKLTPHVRSDGDDRRSGAGPDPAILALALSLPAQVAVSQAPSSSSAATASRSWPVTPYAARAPPVFTV